jgi:hypothetical protein
MGSSSSSGCSVTQSGAYYIFEFTGIDFTDPDSIFTITFDPGTFITGSNASLGISVNLKNSASDSALNIGSKSISLSSGQQAGQTTTFEIQNSSFILADGVSASNLEAGTNVHAFTFAASGYSSSAEFNMVNFVLGDPSNNVFYSVPEATSSNNQSYVAWDPANTSCGIESISLGGIPLSASSGASCQRFTGIFNGVTQSWLSLRLADSTPMGLSVRIAGGTFVSTGADSSYKFTAIMLNRTEQGLTFRASAESLFASQPFLGFRAGNIISDENFFDTDAMSVSEVQAFLESRVPNCTINNGQPSRAAGASFGSTVIADTCLKDYSQATPNMAEQPGICSAYQGSSSESAASIIAKVGEACNISQKVLLVLLEKEQSLVTDTWPTVRQFTQATGFACYDNGQPCATEYSGFFYQVWSAARQFQRYGSSPFTWHPVGGTSNILYQANASQCGSQPVLIENRATAALYYYTPYTPNAAALANLYGTGDQCSSYGIRNFWRLYRDWFIPTI